MPSPTIAKPPHDRDQSLTIEWNLSSGSVRFEFNRTISSDNASIARVFCSVLRFVSMGRASQAGTLGRSAATFGGSQLVQQADVEISESSLSYGHIH
jgi:hypothetical protein